MGVVGRFVPNQKHGEDDPQCKVYRMKIFAKNKVVARSRFWYFIGRLCRVKKANGQIVSVNQIFEKTPEKAKAASIQILRTSELKASECKRPNIVQFHTQKIKFPLAHRIIKTPKAYKTTFKASSAKTFFG